MPENTPPEIEQTEQTDETTLNRAERRAAKRGKKMPNVPLHVQQPKSGFVPPRQYSTRRRSG